MTEDSGRLELDTGQSYLAEATSDEGLVNCVFSSTSMIKVGTGTTTRSHRTKLYWYVEEIEDKLFAVRQINTNSVPSGDEKIISLDELMAEYSPEVEYFEDQTLPAMQNLDDHLDLGESLREEERFYSAEHCFTNALGIDEKNVRALFNLGLIYLESHNIERARDMMQEILKIKAAFKGKNHHLFNEFGIALRKSGLYDESVEYYAKAVEFAPEDENLFYNLSRANYERGNWEECVSALSQSRLLNPGLGAAKSLAKLIVEMHDKPLLCEKQGKPPVPANIIEALGGDVLGKDRAVSYSPGQAESVDRARGKATKSSEEKQFTEKEQSSEQKGPSDSVKIEFDI
ncbi:tetratricopeptide repeat protein [Pseudodesulfovibrio piezophilus]|uniref:Tetratricopeptide TPR_2 repeat protein n=1 Tax=Pseudodesulfovibrio piezophilus (strain DSM 21447 / JCM 15486 / C1TLV30) TaxID=1322246 RepID=M1WY05_PSEP2|nr:tetratricopeptide repeat protein [Pseudodesulfovibrio piezophilus]CCH50038.1 Tetratricopeptide TPR_2 repeat protein [Pseudodesulfovibrio piezophilus C1TLV30]